MLLRPSSKLERARFLACVAAMLSLASGIQFARADDNVLARVNGDDITSADLELQLVLFRPESRDDPAVRQRVLEQLIEQSLISAWLDERRIDVDADAVETRIELLQQVMQERGLALEEVLKPFGRTLESLREEQSLPVRWETYIRGVVTQDQIAEHFDAHRAELDGTQVRISHIILAISADDPEEVWSSANDRLAAVREEIESGVVTFKDAARGLSDSPSGDAGGDVGFVNFHGEMPIEVCRAAFAMAIGEISEPIRSSYGVHLVQVTDIQPGQLSLEDVRETIIEALGEDLWSAEVARLGEAATIERLTDTP